MKFLIHFSHQDVEMDDSFIVSGKTIDEIREKAEQELKKRCGKNPWSEEIEE